MFEALVTCVLANSSMILIVKKRGSNHPVSYLWLPSHWNEVKKNTQTFRTDIQFSSLFFFFKSLNFGLTAHLQCTSSTRKKHKHNNIIISFIHSYEDSHSIFPIFIHYHWSIIILSDFFELILVQIPLLRKKKHMTISLAYFFFN